MRDDNNRPFLFPLLDHGKLRVKFDLGEKNFEIWKFLSLKFFDETDSAVTATASTF